ncbi:MAG TPA: tRNA epoxyqueuosine(34) reductase QueG, partial [Afipia sp.]|nr:tRNA epoxyqueuosine(34) reductase QueG [Afipia sp.]
MDAVAIKAALTEEARTIGFGTIGITDPDAIAGARERLQTFLDAGSHGDMEWLANEPAR